MAIRKATTTTISGGADYAKVAERLRLFREQHPHGKQESAYEVDVDGSVVFTVWLWKDKSDLIELLKSGVTDREALRASADANGNAKGSLNGKEKDFEKLETIALGRALGMLGFSASGEIASSEEMEEFEKYQRLQHLESIEQALMAMELSTTLDELKEAFRASKLMQDPTVIAAKDKLKAKLTKEAKREIAQDTPKQ